MDKIEIGMGKLYVADGTSILSTSGIGSCVAVCLWSQSDKKGGLAHIMLPKRPITLGEITEDDFRYGDIAIEAMVKELEKRGVRRDQLIAKIIGGANMFPGIQARSQKVGEKNIEFVKEILKEKTIPISAEETGGSSGRSISFDLLSGVVTINMSIQKGDYAYNIKTWLLSWY